MTHYLPGSTIEAESLSAESADRLISPMFLSGGLMLSQVAALTGLEPYTIQNWVKRGFLPPPQNKRYTIRQFCRILLINMLKDSFQLDTVCSLLSYINGHLDDESDDIILLDNDEVDVEELARDAFILDMDTKFLCSEDCRGLCPGCGVNLNRESCRCKKAVDPRLAKLAQLLQKDE